MYIMVVATTQAVALKAKLFYGFSDTSRLSILEALCSGPKNVTQLVQETGLSQPNVSNHLSCLHDCGLVSRTQQGRYVVYAHSDPRVSQFLELADELLADVAKGVYECTRYQLPEVSTHDEA
jgi:ArsR family transcriptional regulator, cadmium/lead-responsive transcriptional repressor